MTTSAFNILQANPPCGSCESECCAHVPMTKKEIDNCLEWMRTNLSAEYVLEIRDQQRPEGMCIFVDTKQWRCTVYAARPQICRWFGFTEFMPCSYAPGLATLPKADFAKLYIAGHRADDVRNVTMMGDLFTWNDVSLEISDEEDPNASKGL